MKIGTYTILSPTSGPSFDHAPLDSRPSSSTSHSFNNTTSRITISQPEVRNSPPRSVDLSRLQSTQSYGSVGSSECSPPRRPRPASSINTSEHAAESTCSSREQASQLVQIGSDDSLALAKKLLMAELQNEKNVNIVMSYLLLEAKEL